MQKLYRTLLVATMLIVFFFAFPYLINLSNPGAIIAQVNEEISEVTIPVEGMTCSGCEFNIENALKKLDGIIEVKADYQKGQVYVKSQKGKVNVDDRKTKSVAGAVARNEAKRSNQRSEHGGSDK